MKKGFETPFTLSPFHPFTFSPFHLFTPSPHFPMTEEVSPLSPNHEETNRNHKWLMLVFNGIIIAFVVCVIAALSSPMVIRSKKRGPLSEAINNAKQIGFALDMFNEEFIKYPSPSSASEVKEANPDEQLNLSGNSSNAIFRQFFATEITESELMFYAKIKSAIKPDGNTSPGETLKQGEVGFSYISGLSSKDNPLTPIVVTPLTPGTTKFDSKPFDGKAIVLHINNSVTTYDINKDGHIYDKDGDILSPNHPFWNEKAPLIHYPE